MNVGKKISAVIILLIVLLIGWILFRTFNAKSWPKHQAAPLAALPSAALAHLSTAISIPTVSPQDPSRIDSASFLQYRAFLDSAYPMIHQRLSRDIVAGFSYVYTWRGIDSSLPPLILMAHYDVVPVEPSALNLWTVKPFGGEIKADTIFGRGAVDDKCSMIAIMETVEALLRKNYTPRRTVLLCFGHNEESTGQGAAAIVQLLQQRNIRAEMVVDEGGEFTREKLGDLQRPVALIGIGEKGYATFELLVEKEGGHSSRPDKETSIDILSRALYKLRGEQTPRRILDPTREFLTRISGSSNDFPRKMALNNLWLFEGYVLYKLGEDKDGRAMISTTVVPTILESGVRENVIPSQAKAIVNTRILPGESIKEVQEFIRKAVDDPRVKIKVTGDFSTEPSPMTDFHSDVFKKVADAASAVEDDVIPVPYVMVGATDSRNFRAISNGVVNFCPITDGKGYHGIDERLPIRDFQRAIQFYTLLIQ
ncbi:MAG TPA: M20/M25/M40 family metallo-hydrolase [Puia sp.]|nr:M20/M25/M40 family metallo-hydrolase [Puia sp.]